MTAEAPRQELNLLNLFMCSVLFFVPSLIAAGGFLIELGAEDVTGVVWLHERAGKAFAFVQVDI